MKSTSVFPKLRIGWGIEPQPLSNKKQMTISIEGVEYLNNGGVFCIKSKFLLGCDNRDVLIKSASCYKKITNNSVRIIAYLA